VALAIKGAALGLTSAAEAMFQLVRKTSIFLTSPRRHWRWRTKRGAPRELGFACFFQKL
jgi:hypothetical protein